MQDCFNLIECALARPIKLGPENEMDLGEVDAVLGIWSARSARLPLRQCRARLMATLPDWLR